MKNSMKNSIFITTNLNKNTGGGNVSHHELNSLLHHTDVKLILSDHENNDYPIKVNSINPQDHKLPKNEFLWDYLAYEKVSPVIDKNDIDIVFINGNPFGKTVKHIVDHHTINNRKKPKIIVDVPAHDLRESIDEHNKLNEVKYDKCYPHMVDPFLWKMQTDHIKDADIIICPSKYSVEALRTLDLLKNQDIKVIHHGVEIPSKENVIHIPEDFRVGYMGSCMSDKGIIYAIQSWNKLSYNDSIFLYAGPHETYFRDSILRLQPQTGARYMIMGFVPNMSEVYNNISVYIQPSITEGWGLEVAEAMSYGRPVICSNGAGASEMITDGSEGFVFPKRDVNKLMEYIQYFKNNPSEIKKMGNNARKRAEQYTWDNIEKKYAELFNT